MMPPQVPSAGGHTVSATVDPIEKKIRSPTLMSADVVNAFSALAEKSPHDPLATSVTVALIGSVQTEDEELLNRDRVRRRRGRTGDVEVDVVDDRRVDRCHSPRRSRTGTHWVGERRGKAATGEQ